ncbi:MULTISPECIES: hypothetical protein [Ruminococcus]|uniref:Uncharacterized protein n=1 Tax=Ruminococcus flavefaciens TaxID=1265 RepID=A0A1M7JSE3_RUMFL|nr:MULTISPECIES: hypothetical protein [Ruminococcus]MCR4796294.1 hypothetical protein [Ruminococcus sp.]SHM55936.1 hypothetical protein SAMN04487860_106191 [Ruminococcus flavefaciens]
MDNFAEQLIKKNETSADKTRRVMLIVVGVLFTISLAALAVLQLSNPLIALLGFALAAAAGYGTYYFVQNTYVEYEYSFTNGELDVDKIIAKKKRREMLSTNVRQFTAFGKYSDDIEESDDMTIIFATDNIASHEYYADFNDESAGSARLVFAPDERMLENITKFLPAKLRTKLS